MRFCRRNRAVNAQRNACDGHDRVALAALGDVPLHRPLARRGHARGFAALSGNTTPRFRAEDIAIANSEGPTATGIVRAATAPRALGRRHS